MPVADQFAPALSALTEARARMAPASTSGWVAAALREQLSDGVLRPGSRIPEEAIAEALSVSRNTIREAFVQLANERLVERVPNRGVFVVEVAEDDVSDIYRTRRLIEIAAVRGGGSEEAVARVRKAVVAGEQAYREGDSQALGIANQHFHRALVGMANSDRLNVAMTHILAEMRLVFHAAGVTDDFHASFLQPNDAVCRSLESGDTEGAAKLLEQYLKDSEQRILHNMANRHR